MFALQLYVSSKCLPFLLPSSGINYTALSRAPESVSVLLRGLYDRWCFGLPVAAQMG